MEGKKRAPVVSHASSINFLIHGTSPDALPLSISDNFLEGLEGLKIDEWECK